MFTQSEIYTYKFDREMFFLLIKSFSFQSVSPQ